MLTAQLQHSQGARAAIPTLLPAALRRLGWLAVLRGEGREPREDSKPLRVGVRLVLAEPDAYLLLTVTSLSKRVITAWLKIYTCGTEFQPGSHMADWKVRTESLPKLGDVFCSQQASYEH